ncbi:glutathione S-transferase C-terminal domain-containing protein [Lacticaseibacillus jixiensis]|uniref:glutathione S-transferase C-terminal domain-containing protein n=1 Tax=Lacticaseibacillus jixiensis TaxID=3231926 RepID=UPI0036F3F3DC
MANTCAWQPGSSQPVKSPVTIDRRFTTGELPVAADRYTLIWGRFCPWASQSAIIIDLLHLPIAKSAIYPYRRGTLDDDWVFGPTDDQVDPILQIARVSQAYRQALPDLTGRPTVPALVDRTTGAVVNNDANVLVNELTSQWGDTTLSPAGVLEFSAYLLNHINRAPGAILDAKSQADYDAKAQAFFADLAKLDQRLSDHAYIFGDRLSQADVRLFVTLVRFDLVYSQQNKLNYRRLQDYPHLWAYAKRLYQIPAFHDNTDFAAIYAHFYQVSDLPVTTFERMTPYNDRAAAWQG